ncbi:MAG: trypsin-like peptidase domain-containing protein [Phycisphaerae bacterium]|jgi:serine protease Do
MRPSRLVESLVVGAIFMAFWPAPARSQEAAAASRTEGGYELLKATQEVFRSVASDMRRYLVRIDTVGGSQPPNRVITSDDGEESEGPPRPPNPFRELPGSSFEIADGPTTGLIYSSDGYIVTSSFNFVREPLLISVTLSDGRRLEANLVARDQVRKVALLKVDATDLAVPEWSDPRAVEVGQWAVALGMGFGGDAPSVTAGIVGAVGRMNGNAVQTDAKLSPANYGGPLCNVRGRVIGLTVPMGQRPGELAGVELYDSGVGFAIPKDRLEEIVSVLRTGKSLHRGWLGINLNPMAAGVVIRNIADPSPMREAGVLPGDRILSVNGREVRQFQQLVKALYMIPAGDEVELRLEREDEEFTAIVRLARNTELGPLPELEVPEEAPSLVPPGEDEE